MYDLFIFLGWERYRTHQECCKTMAGSRLSPPESTLSRRAGQGVTSSRPLLLQDQCVLLMDSQTGKISGSGCFVFELPIGLPDNRLQHLVIRPGNGLFDIKP